MQSTNETLQILHSHRSCRDFQAREIKDEDLAQILQAIKRVPSWINGQHTSVIIIKDKARKQRLAKLCGNQEHIAQAPVFLLFCADFYKTALACKMHGEDAQSLCDNLGVLFVGAHEAGIALEAAVVASEALGLASVAIGDVRRNPLEMIDELKLPQFVLPMIGLCIGYATSNSELKPRLSNDAMFFNEAYNTDLTPLLQDFDKEYEKYTKSREGKARSFTKTISNFYKAPYNHHLDIAKMLIKQGFFKDKHRLRIYFRAIV